MSRPSAVPRELSLRMHAWPCVSLAGREVPIGLKNGLALLAYLAMDGNRVSRQRMAMLLWPGADAATSRTRLRRLVYAFNGQCGAEIVRGDADALWIDAEAWRLECDVLDAQAQARALASPSGTAAGASAEALLHADAHRLLDGFAIESAEFEHWLVAQRANHERLVGHALQRLAERGVAAGAIALAIDAANRLVAMDPHAERGHAALMIALGHRGDAGAIESTYFRCAQGLREEYGIPPSDVVETAYASAMAMARSAAASAHAGESAEMEIRHARSADGVRLAYAVSGSGPPLIKAANWLSHLEYDRGNLVWGHLVRELSRHFAYVCYDERGCGLSDWDVADLSFPRWVDDLETVVQAIGAERFPLLGISQGASIAIDYAVRHPERVSHLVLHGGYARGRLVRSDTPGQREEAETMAKLAELGWGKPEPSFRQFFTSQFIPDGTTQQHEWFNELERVSTSPANAARFMREFAVIDVVGLLPRVRCPTLVLHSLDDVRVPVEEGRLIADGIHGARFVPVHSRNHLLLEHEAAWPHWLEEVRTFLAT